MTVVVNHDTASVVWCSKGYGKEVLSLFFEQLSPEQRASIRCVSADGARWIASCVEEYCPNAERCVDPFHVVSWATEALDKVRRQAWAEAHETAQSAPKRGRGRPTKEEEATPQKRLAKGIKNLRYSLLKNPEHLSENQQAQLDFLMIMIQRKPPSRHSMTLFIKMIRALHSLLIGFSIIISQIMHCRLSYIPFAQAWQKHPPCASFYAHHLAEGTAYSNQFRRFSHSIRAINCANPSYSLSLTSPHVLRKYLYFSFEPGVGESVPVTAAQF